MSGDETRRERRGRGEGGLYWNERRQRFVAEETVGYNAKGARIVRGGSGKTEAEALRNKRKAVERYRAGLMPDSTRVTVAQVVTDWLEHGQGSRTDAETRKKNRNDCEVHIIPFIGGQRLHRLTAPQVENWLAERAEHLATRSLQGVRSCLRRAIRRAQAHGLVDRNVVELVECPRGRPGRPSKALTLGMCRDILTKTEVTGCTRTSWFRY